MASSEAGIEVPAPPGPLLARRRLHPLSPVLDGLVMAARSWPLLLGLLFQGPGWQGIALVALAAVITATAVLRWVRTSYSVDAGGLFRLERGVLSRSERLVPLDRIQEVSELRKLRHRAAGVVALRIETAGGGRGSDVVLDAVSDAEAASLGRLLRSRRSVPLETAPAGPLPGPAPDPATSGAALAAAPVLVPEPVPGASPAGLGGMDPTLRLGPAALAVAGITGIQLLAAPAALVGLISRLDDLPNWVEDTVLDAAGELSRVVAVAGLLVVALGVAAVLPMVRNFRYQLSRTGNELRLQRGLLEERALTVDRGRVQAVRIAANPVRRPLGLARVSVDTTAAARRDSVNEERSGLAVPLTTPRTLPQVLSLVLGEDRGAALPGSHALPPALTAHPRGARTRATVAASLGLALIAAATAPAIGLLAGWRWAPLPAALLLSAPLLGRAAYRLAGHHDSGGLLWARSGLVGWHLDVAVLAKAQGASITRSPGQRRLGLATVKVHLAGRLPVRVVDVDVKTAERLAALAIRRRSG
jgi:putative membrane protein